MSPSGIWDLQAQAHDGTASSASPQDLRRLTGDGKSGTRTPRAMPCQKDGVLAMRWASPEMGDGVPSNPSQSRRPHLSGRQVNFWRRGRACGLGRVEEKMLSPLTRLEKKRPRSIRAGHIQVHRSSSTWTGSRNGTRLRCAACVSERQTGPWLLHVDPMRPGNGTWCLLSAHQRPTGATGQRIFLFVKSFLDGSRTQGGVHEKMRVRVWIRDRKTLPRQISARGNV